MKKSFEKISTLFASLILLLPVASANQTCSFFHHQLELPDEVKKLRKF